MLAKVAVLTALKNGAFWVFSLLNQPWQSYSCCTGVRNYLVWKRKTHKNLTGLRQVTGILLLFLLHLQACHMREFLFIVIRCDVPYLGLS